MKNKTLLRHSATALLTAGLSMTLACGPSGDDGNNDDNNSNNTTGSNNSNNTAGSNNSNNTAGSNNSNNTTGSNNSNNSNNTTGSNNSNNTTGSNNSNNSNNTTGSNNSNNSNNTTGSNNSNNTTGGDRDAAAMAIGDFRAEMTGTVSGAFVTYVRPAVGSEGAGFFIQATQEGPAIFVEVDPATLTPVPVVGDEVELTVDTAEISNDVPSVTAISAFTVLSNGNDLSGLTQDVSAIDVVTDLGDYDSEMVTLSGTVAGDFGFAGTGFLAAKLTTTGVPDSEDMRLRLPEDLANTLALTPGCEVVLPGTPLWRFRDDAQPSAWVAGDITVTSCAQPTVTGAIATSDTEVVLTFDRPVDAASITNAATQFTADNGLSVSAATVAGNEVTLTTSNQTGGTAYTLTVADTVLDDLGNAVDMNSNTAAFTGFIPFAKVLLNEVAPNVDEGCDIIELRVTQDGTLNGFTIEERGNAVYTFGALNVVKNDYILVHFDKADMACNGANPVDELAKNDMTEDTTLNILDLAYDVFSDDTGITNTNNVISVRNPTGALEDTMIFATASTLTSFAAASETAADEVLQEGGWGPVNGAPPATYADPDIGQDAVVNDATNPKFSLSRINDTDANNKGDWTTEPKETTYGANNVGQSDL